MSPRSRYTEAVIEAILASVTNLYAFFYQPSPPHTATDGWSLYSPRDEFGRMGVGLKTKAWRFTDVNKDYTVRVVSLNTSPPADAYH